MSNRIRRLLGRKSEGVLDGGNGNNVGDQLTCTECGKNVKRSDYDKVEGINE